MENKKSNIIIPITLFTVINIIIVFSGVFLMKNDLSKIKDTQNRILTRDSVFSIEQIKYRNELSSKIEVLNSDIKNLSIKNSNIESKFKATEKEYKETKYKPIKYWK